MVQTGPMPKTAIVEQFTKTRVEAATMREMAAEMRSRSRADRTKNYRRRHETIRTLWRTRQLRYDQHGPILAMCPAGAHPDGTPPTIAVLNDVIIELFSITLVLAGSLTALKGPDRERVQVAIEETDLLIREIRLAAFTQRANTEPGLWLGRIQRATDGIDGMFANSPELQTSVLNLREASQAAHRAITALGPKSE